MYRLSISSTSSASNYMHIRLIISSLLWIGCLMVRGNATIIPTYDKSMCNRTITISPTEPLGRLYYTHDAKDNNSCNVVIETENDHRIGYFFLETSAFQTIRVNEDSVTYSCLTWVQISDGTHRLANKRCVYSKYNQTLHTTTGSKLKLEINGDDVTAFLFKLVFYSFHEGSCANLEQKCDHNYNKKGNSDNNICIHTDILCDNAYSHVICNSSAKICSDFISDDSRALLSSTAIAVGLSSLLLFVLGTMCVVSCRRRCGKSKDDIPEVPTVARALFGSMTSEHCDCDAYYSIPTAGVDIDLSKFDPPPEYSTLEFCEQDKNVKQKDKVEARMSVVSLPSYNDVMNNSGNYSVATHM